MKSADRDVALSQVAGRADLGPSPVIRDYKAFFESLIAYIPEGITIAEAPDTTIVAVSKHGQLIAGRDLGELTGKPAKDHPDQWQVYHLDGETLAAPEELPLTRATKSGEVVSDEEWLLRRPDGTFAHILCNAGPVSDQHGERKWGIIAWREISELREAQRELAQERLEKLKFKEAMLQELQHRVKNHMTLIQSALRLQARTVGNAEAEAAIVSASERVGAVAAMYEGLDAHTESEVSLKQYLERVIGNLTPILQGGEAVASVTLDCENISIDAERAMNVAMIVSELVTNARKHAIDEDGRCEIAVKARQVDGRVELTIADRGGLASTKCLEGATGLGLKIVEAVASKLHARLKYEADGGLVARLTFSL